MDADWGSSSDEEDAAERAQRDAEKLKETMALLEAFEKTREPVRKADYGSTGEQFREERAQAAGRANWEVLAPLPPGWVVHVDPVMMHASAHDALSASPSVPGRCEGAEPEPRSRRKRRYKAP